MPHSNSVAFLLLLCTSPAQIAGQERANNLPKSFHDGNLNITYFYPAHFVPVNTSSAADKCVQTRLTAESAIPAGRSSFAVTTMDDSCPELLREAASLASFTRERLLQQLREQGTPSISHEPARYVIDGRPAAVTLASVSLAPSDHNPGRTLYAAKACTLGEIPGKQRRKSAGTGAIHRLLCFDFTTQNRDLVSLLFGFIVQFGDDPPEPLFPISIHPGYWATGGRKPD